MLEFSVMIAIVMSLSEIVKRIGFINNKFLPIINLAMGIVISVAYSGDNLKEAIILGIAIGIAASGGHMGVNKLFCRDTTSQNDKNSCECTNNKKDIESQLDSIFTASNSIKDEGDNTSAQPQNSNTDKKDSVIKTKKANTNEYKKEGLDDISF